MENAKLSSIFGNETITKKTSVRLDDSVDRDDAVDVYYTVLLEGAQVKDVLDNNFSVTLRNSKLKNSFDSQDELKVWADKNATEENPYKVHIDDLGKVLSEEEKFDPETRKKMLIAKAKAMGLTAEDLK